jgi:hypothetical protein
MEGYMISLKRSAACIGILFFGYLAFSCNSNKHSGSAARFNVGDTVIVRISSTDWEFYLPMDNASKDCCLVVNLKAGRPDTSFNPQPILKSDTTTALARPDTQWDPSIKDTSWVKKILIVKEVYTDCEDE